MPSWIPSSRPKSTNSNQPSTSYDSFFGVEEPEQGEEETESGPVVRPFIPDEDEIHIVGTNVMMRKSRLVEIDLPPKAQSGDLLVMFLHRTDDYMPYFLPNWERKAWCFKGNNHYNCATECIQLSSVVGDNGERYCRRFQHPGRRGQPPTYEDTFDPIRGQDLSQAVFVRDFTEQGFMTNQTSIAVDFSGSESHEAWIILVVIRGANTIDPVRDSAVTGADLSNHSVFPHVVGEPNDIILFSQSFDDRVGCRGRLGEEFVVDAASLSTQSFQTNFNSYPQCQGSFRNPNGTQLLGYVAMNDMDAAGFLWGGTLLQHVDYLKPSIWRTEGQGKGNSNPDGLSVKDLLMSMTIRP